MGAPPAVIRSLTLTLTVALALTLTLALVLTRWAYRQLPGAGKLERCHTRAAPASLSHERNVPKAWLKSVEPGKGGWLANPDANVTGPFFFPKGPLYLISRQLVSETLAGEWASAEAERAVASGADFTDEATWPWEDVFLGAALARSVRPAAHAAHRPLAVHIGANAAWLGYWTKDVGALALRLG